jgi:hypothetical protein
LVQAWGMERVRLEQRLAEVDGKQKLAKVELTKCIEEHRRVQAGLEAAVQEEELHRTAADQEVSLLRSHLSLLEQSNAELAAKLATYQ